MILKWDEVGHYVWSRLAVRLDESNMIYDL